ncbi:hypothetical protein GOP47_0012244 [Adiantum capillus-veneris]|uniref:Auxin transport protein BIG n=1 Tax=Adiantum capillus-veneris TaxID=13818 RepID=A0A9D4URN8_ADICA|nr:hypothetical protein GOP47_0012244 [Adiantum capillus-veneris]
MAQLQPLVDVLHSPGSSSPPLPASTSPQSVSDPSLQHALRHLSALISRLPSYLQQPQVEKQEEKEEEEKGDDKKNTELDSLTGRDTHSWSSSQLDFVLNLTQASIFHFRHVPIELGLTEPVEGVFCSTIDACIESFKKLTRSGKAKESLSSSDEQLYNKLLHLMELALDEGKTMGAPPILNCSKEELQGLDIYGPLNVSFQEFRSRNSLDSFKIGRQETEITEDILQLLTSDQPLKLGIHDVEKSLPEFSNMISASQHYAVSNAGVHRELVSTCGSILANFDFKSVEDSQAQLRLRLSLISRMLRLLCSLSKFASGFPHMEDIVSGLVALVAWTPQLLMEEVSLNMEEINNYCCYATFISSVIALAEAVGFGNCFTQNLRLFVAASALDILVSTRSNSGKGLPLQKLPAVLEPQVVSYISGLITAMHAQNWRSNGISHARKHGRSWVLCKSPMLNLRSQHFDLTVERSQREMMQMVFPDGETWLVGLLNAVGQLYSIGTEASPAGEKALLRRKEIDAGSSVEGSCVPCEDEALFGNLFSESSRQPSSSDSNSLSHVENRSCVFHDTVLQAVINVLIFIRDCIFCLGCQTSCYQGLQKHMNAEGIDLLLQIFFHSSSEKVDAHCSIDLILQLSKVTFDLINFILVNGILSFQLEQHLLCRILETGYMGCTMPSKTLAILIKVLIHHSSTQGAEQHDLLTLAVWKSFREKVASSFHDCEWADLPVVEAAANLPSVFLVEALLMAFHSSSASARLSILKDVKVLLSDLSDGSINMEVTRLDSCSLLFSKMMMIFKYMCVHFKAFPSWLITDLKVNLSRASGEGSQHSTAVGFSFASMAATTGQGLRDAGPVSGQTGVSDAFLAQLYDINVFCKGDGDLTEISESMGGVVNVGGSILGFLDRWRGRAVLKVEEMLVERHTFFIGWSTICSFSKGSKFCTFSEFSEISGDTSGAELILRFTQTLLSFFYHGPSKGADGILSFWQAFLKNTISGFEALGERAVKNFSIDRLRQNSMLSLLIYFLQKGFEVSNAITSQESQHEELQNFCRHLACGYKDDGSLEGLLKTLLSILSSTIDSFHHSVLDILNDKQKCEVSPSVLLVLRGGLSWTKQDQLFTKLGVSFSPLHTLLRRGMPVSWHTEMLSKVTAFGNFSDLEKFFLPSLLHGHPCSYHPASAMVMSCMCLIDCVLDTIKSILKADKISGHHGVVEGLLEPLMVVKFEEIFESVVTKCEEVLSVLHPSKDERSGVCHLYLIKQKEALLKALSCSGQISDSIREELILHVVEVFTTIYTDPTRCDVFRQYFTSGGGSLSSLVDVLDGCHQETVNLKVLQFLTNVVGIESMTHGGLGSALQEKLLKTDSKALSLWLEQRLLGSSNKPADGSLTIPSSSNSVRDVLVAFLNGLVSSEFTLEGKDLHSHLLNSLLLSLDQAFSCPDSSGRRSYFTILLQLANREPYIRRVLQSVIQLMGKLSGQSIHMEGLKALLTFLISLLNSFGNQRGQILCKVVDGKGWHASVAGLPHSTNKNKLSEPRKTLEIANAVMDQSGHSADCDAVSVDDEEDDGTSDGEITSLEKDEEDDGNNSEKTLASRVCTFTSSGNNFMEQHWYFCYTCDLTVSKGCCSVCAKVCHRGHKVVYSRLSRFFCDCGAGGVRGQSCVCLKPRKYVSPAPVVTSTDQEQPPSDSDSDLDDDVWIDNEKLSKASINECEETQLLSVLSDLDVEGHVLALCDRLLNNFNWIKCSMPSIQDEIGLGDDKNLILKSDFMQLRRFYKSGSFDMKIKAEYVNAKELKSHLVNGTLFKSVLSTNGRGKLAVGEGDKVTIFDVEQVIGPPSSTPVTVDKTTVKPLSKNSVRFELVHLEFNRANESYLAVAGYEDCQIFTVNSRGEVTDRLAVELALQDSHICRVLWVPGSQVQLMVVTSRFVKVYDLSQDNISPVQYCTILEDHIMDASLIPLGQGQFVLVVLSYSGFLYRFCIAAGAEPGARVLTENILIPDRFQVTKGVSLHYSSALKLLLVSFSDGLSLVGRLDTEATCFLEVLSLLEVDHDGKPNGAGLHHWTGLDGGRGLFVALNNQRSNSAVAISFGSVEIEAQYLRSSGSLGCPRVDGITSYRSSLKEKHDLLILHDDGSLQVFCVGQGNESVGDSVRTSTLEAEQVKKLGDAILGSRAGNSPAPVFPLDFFEKTTCITNDIRLGGDVLRNLDSEGAKMSLASDDGFLEGPNPSGFKITIFNSNADVVMVGCRVHVGNSSTSHIPSELRIFQRAVKLEEGVRSWYDLPFTNAEALLADEEFTLTVGSTFGGFSLPRIDNLEVYGRPKEDFGWKEKLEAVLDMETQASVSGSVGSRSKLKFFKSASTEEQIVADCFRFLFSYFMAVRTKSTLELSGINIEASRRRCKPLLELVFESDRQPYLQAAARRVLHALYPTKDAFYQAKDTLRLTGVSRVCPVLASKMRLGGSTLSSVTQEFTVQLRAVCKIALHRRSNFASFLECHGPSIIEDLMKVLWELLTLDLPDADTVNCLIVPSVDLIYGYAECLALRTNNGLGTLLSVAPAVTLFKKLLFAPHEIVRASCSLAMSSRLLQVPFPKQTILAHDDIGENTKSTTLPSESGPGAGGSDGQVMMDEDGGNASVQFCCDGCSTVPIVGRRWHCNICPDFDLCEACYEIMDGDRLPPPHSRDHPMSAILIDNDNAVGDIGFASIEDLSDENLLQVATALSMQTGSIPLGSSLDVSDSRTDSLNAALESRGTTISASKRALNSLLLKSLIDESRGWMKQMSGAQALPLMQFFYRLASACTSPFIEASGTESINLEMFVTLLLEELSLGDPLSIKTRSNFGEVVVLVFTFFNLMLRNWHQPGSDHSLAKPTSRGGEVSQAMPSSSGTGSPSSDEGQVKGESGTQLDRACAALRQQQLMNYLFLLVQQLGQIFKSSSRNLEASPVTLTGAVCGALLTVKKEFAAGNFAPFFTDSYAKAHRNDLFGEFHRLLLESTFRLAYNLVRPEKGSDKDQVSGKMLGTPDLKLDGWQEVLCSFINNPHTTSIRRFARRLLLHLCGSKGHYYNVRDAWQLSREVRKLFKLVQKAGGFHSLLVYERSVKLVKCLSAVVEVASARPRNWQKYCSRHPEILQFLFSGIFAFGEESVVQTLKLLMLAFYAGKESGVSSASKGETADSANAVADNGTKQNNDVRKKKRGSTEDSPDTGSEKPFLDMELSVEQLAAEDGSVLLRFIDAFLLEWNASCVRAEAKAVLMGAWYHGKSPVRELLLKKLLLKVPVLPSYGQNITAYTELLTWILGKGLQGSGSNNQEYAVVQSCLTNNAVKVLFDTLCSQNELLANHPNSRIYYTLSSLVDFDGYYLESEPCLACSCPEVPYTRMKLDSLKSETKFTDNRILVKCVGSHTIQSVTMNVHDARRSKSVKVLNLYYNNKPVTDLSELKNNWSLWKRAKSCYLAFNQTELKVEFSIPITACNFMIELDAFYENLQASSLESLQCPRCSRYVTDKHGICGNCHENAYQCRQCRNINYENLDSFLCNECGYSKYGRFEFNFMAKPSFNFENMENDEDMKKGLAAIELESENAHKRYQQLLGFKKPLLKLVSSIGETETDSQQKDSVQQMIVSLPGSSSFKINRKIAILGVLYGEKCKMAFDSVSRSVQNLQGLRRVLSSYLEQKRSSGTELVASKPSTTRPSNRCYGCANTFVAHCLEWLQVLAKMPHCRQQLVSAGILAELFENNIHQGSKMARVQARSVLCAFTEGDTAAVGQLNNLIKQKALYCLDHHRSIDIATCVREELSLLSETCALVDEFWESRLRVVFQLLFTSIQVGARHPVIAEHIILPCLRIISQACTPPKAEASIVETEKPSSGQRSETRTVEIDQVSSAIHRVNNVLVPKTQSSSLEKDSDQELRGHDAPLVSYVEWKNGAAYVDFVRRQYIASQGARPAVLKTRRDPKRAEFLALKYILRWKRRACKISLKNEFSAFEESSWVCELALSACSQAIRVEMCGLIEVLCSQSPARRSKFLNLLMALLPATRTAGESACDYFELLHKMIETEDARLFLTVRGFLQTLCKLITEEVNRIEAQEHTFHVDISQGYILHKLIELLGKFLQVPNIRVRFMKEGLLSQILEALLVVRGLVVQKTKLIGDCSRLLRDLSDGLLEESFENKRHFIRACIVGLQTHRRLRNDRTLVYILELLCNIICPMKPEPAYMMVLNKAHTQEEFIRGSMTKNPYSSLEVGPLMRDVKNKICHQLDLLGLIEDDYGMELLVAGHIISLDLSVAQVYEQVWKKFQNQQLGSGVGSGGGAGTMSGRECPPMTITYRLQGLDGEATEPMIKELEDDREETQDPEVEFCIAGVMRECDGLEVVLNMVEALTDDEIRSSQEELALVLKLLMYCCKIRENRLALLALGALGVLIDTSRRAFAVEATESAERLLLIVECLVTEANENDIGIAKSSLSVSKLPDGDGSQAAYVVQTFLERLSHAHGAEKSSKQQRNNDMVARILPYLTYGEQTAMELLVKYFDPYLHDWSSFDQLIRMYNEKTGDVNLPQQATQQLLALENFCKVTESIKHDAQGEKLKGIIMEKGIITECIQHLRRAFAVFESASDYKATVEWAQSLELPSIPIILSILKGLSSGHKMTQKSLKEGGVLPLLHALEGVPGESEIGVRAENLMDALADKEGKGEGFLSEEVMKLRHATREETRKRALQKREELLQGLGMRSETTSGGERIVISLPSIEGLDDVQEEEAGLACMVCREGYSLCPSDMLGTYCYSKRVNLGIGTNHNTRAEWVYTTVSHFNVIHFQCHLEAKRADASLRNPKKEWDGAALRNNETLCNNLFPLRGPSVSLSQYARCVDQYWDNLNALGRADGSRLRLLIYDVVLMLARFATGASFSTDSKGGGKESNSRLLPFMLQMACHLYDQGGVSQKRLQSKALATYLNTPSLQEITPSGSKSSTGSGPQRLGAVDETVQFMMFKHGRSSLAASPVASAAAPTRSSAESLNSTSFSKPVEDDLQSGAMDNKQLFTVVQPMLIYTGLVDQLQHYLKLGPVRTQACGSVQEDHSKGEGGSVHAALEPWEVAMKERLRDIKAMLGFSNKLLEWLDEMQRAEDLQEAFDVMGALGDALAGHSSCEEFIIDAINSNSMR